MRRLGKNQVSLLESLKDHGSWHPGCGWVWDNTGNTIRILESLVKRSLVVRRRWKGSRYQHIYTLSKAGNKVVDGNRRQYEQN
jgi:hypothetical protein